MSIQPKIEVPQEILDAIHDYLETLDKEMATSEAATGSKNGEMWKLDAALADLDFRIKKLSRDGIESDTAAAELAVIERRKRLIMERRSELAGESGAPAPSLVMAAIVCRQIFIHWVQKVPEKILEQLAPFGFPDHLLAPFVAHTQAMAVLRIMLDFPVQFPEATPKNVARLKCFFRRALRGQVNLVRDEPVETETEAAAAAPAGETKANENPA